MSKVEKLNLLLEAIEHGKPQLVKAIIEEGEVDINNDCNCCDKDTLVVPPRDIDKEGYALAVPPPVTFVPPLSWAVFHGKINATHYLVEKAGAQLDSSSTDGRTALHTAVSKGFIELTKYLVSKGADINSINHAGETPLYFAACFGQDDIFNLLAAQDRIILTVLTDNGFSVLHMAASKGHTEMVKFLLEKTPELTAHVSSNGQTPLSLAARFAQLEVVKLLLEQSAYNPDTIADDAREGILAVLHPLVKAPTQAHSEVLKLLLTCGLLRESDQPMLNPIMIAAAETGNALAVTYLCEHGADVNFQDAQGQTALHHACVHGLKGVAANLIKVPGIDLNIEDSDDYLPITYAEFGDFEDLTKLLLANGAKEAF